MKKFFLLILVSLHYINLNAQDPPIKANVILVHDVSFKEVVNKLLDSGYAINKIDSNFYTIRTEAKQYPKYWSANYTLNIRMKDSIAYISGTFDVPAIGNDYLHLHNEPIYNAKQKKSLWGAAFTWMNNIATSFNKPVEYLVQ